MLLPISPVSCTHSFSLPPHRSRANVRGCCPSHSNLVSLPSWCVPYFSHIVEIPRGVSSYLQALFPGRNFVRHLLRAVANTLRPVRAILHRCCLEPLLSRLGSISSFKDPFCAWFSTWAIVSASSVFILPGVPCVLPVLKPVDFGRFWDILQLCFPNSSQCVNDFQLFTPVLRVHMLLLMVIFFKFWSVPNNLFPLPSFLV